MYKSVDEIDFSKLPQSFVLKTNHDSGGVVLVKDKVAFLKDSKSFSEAMDKLTQHLNTNFYTLYREWHYKDIEPRIFVEEMLLETNANGEAKVPSDYKIHCFGKTKYIQVDTDRFVEHTRSIFDENWNVMPFSLCYPQSTTPPSKPLNFMTMLTIATGLSMPFAMLRVDLYNIQGKIIAGELTFTHGGGTEKFTPNEWDRKLGGLWKLS
ncbi:glycosyl transferase [Helicobacter bilis]|uniref:Glycosyl transferase n=1 Tax=Helicobacter bilis TaxID=37372 RepID=A0A4U8U3M9_9HELI|nr:glycosyl transferase [Helicobacter bilis]